MSACLACGTSARFEPTFARLERCGACGFITYRADGVDPTEIYDDAYFAGEEYPDYLGQERALRRSMQRHLDQMARYAKPGGALLEVGCAYGFFLAEARERYRRTAGVDVAAGPVAHARGKLGLDARQGDLLDLDLSDERFDAVCMWDTVEHLVRPDLYLSRARELLHPGGALFLTTGDIGSINARLRGARWRQIHPPSHLHYFSRATIARLLDRLGFMVLGIETAAYYHTLFNVLGSIALRGGVPGRIAGGALSLAGADLTSRVGLWIDLRDIMFVAARAR